MEATGSTGDQAGAAARAASPGPAELHSDYVAKSLLRAIQLINQLTLELNIDEAMRSVRQVALELMSCERVTLFLVLRAKRELRGRTGTPTDEVLTVRFGEGIAGHVAQSGGLMNIPDAYAHPLFNPAIDAKTGFRTRNMLCCAVQDEMTGSPVAVLQALNKRGGADFSAVDEQHLKLFSVHLGNTLAKIRFYEEAKREKQRMAALSLCFKQLAKASTLDGALDTITCAVQELVRAERVVVFLMDHAREVLWSSFVHPVTGHVRQIRTRQRDGYVGRCATGKQQLCLDLRDEPAARDDPTLQQLLGAVEGGRLTTALLQPVLDPGTDSCMAVLVALNKRDDEVASGAFDEATFTRSDREALSVLSMEVADALSARALEVSFASAMSVVAANGASTHNLHLAHMMRAQLLDYYGGEHAAPARDPISRGTSMMSAGRVSSGALPSTGVGLSHSLSHVERGPHGGGAFGGGGFGGGGLPGDLDRARSRSSSSMGGGAAASAAAGGESGASGGSAFSSFTLRAPPGGGNGSGGGGGAAAAAGSAGSCFALFSGGAALGGSRSGSPQPLSPRRLPRQLSLPAQLRRGPRAGPPVPVGPKLLTFELDCMHMGRDELITVAFDVFMLSGVVEEMGISEATLSGFLSAVASHYHAPASVPYHNFSHAVQVLHTVWLILELSGAHALLSPLEELVLLVAAICHDLDHDGRSNSYHINAHTELAQRYNDRSVQENHHCALTFAVLRSRGANLLDGLPPEDWRAARKLLVDAILATDMSQHYALSQELQKHPPSFAADSEADRALLMKAVLHAADISNPVRPFRVALSMARRVYDEFGLQVAEERRAGLPVTPHMEVVSIQDKAKMEVQFLDYVAGPLWERIAQAFPALQPCIAQMRYNRRRFLAIASGGPVPGGEPSKAPGAAPPPSPGSGSGPAPPQLQAAGSSSGPLPPCFSGRSSVLETTPELAELSEGDGSDGGGGGVDGGSDGGFGVTDTGSAADSDAGDAAAGPAAAAPAPAPPPAGGGAGAAGQGPVQLETVSSGADAAAAAQPLPSPFGEADPVAGLVVRTRRAHVYASAMAAAAAAAQAQGRAHAAGPGVARHALAGHDRPASYSGAVDLSTQGGHAGDSRAGAPAGSGGGGGAG